MDELDELARVLRLHGMRVMRVVGGVMVALDREMDAARAYVVVISSWLSGERYFVWGPVRSMRSPVTDVEGAALELLAYLWDTPVGHKPATWPDPVRDCAGAGRLRWLRARLGTRSSARLGGRSDVGAGGRW